MSVYLLLMERTKGGWSAGEKEAKERVLYIILWGKTNTCSNTILHRIPTMNFKKRKENCESPNTHHLKFYMRVLEVEPKTLDLYISRGFSTSGH